MVFQIVNLVSYQRREKKTENLNRETLKDISRTIRLNVKLVGLLTGPKGKAKVSSSVSAGTKPSISYNDNITEKNKQKAMQSATITM